MKWISTSYLIPLLFSCFLWSLYVSGIHSTWLYLFIIYGYTNFLGMDYGSRERTMLRKLEAAMWSLLGFGAIAGVNYFLYQFVNRIEAFSTSEFYLNSLLVGIVGLANVYILFYIIFVLHIGRMLSESAAWYLLPIAAGIHALRHGARFLPSLGVGLVLFTLCAFMMDVVPNEQAALFVSIVIMILWLSSFVRTGIGRNKRQVMGRNFDNKKILLPLLITCVVLLLFHLMLYTLMFSKSMWGLEGFITFSLLLLSLYGISSYSLAFRIVKLLISALAVLLFFMLTTLYFSVFGVKETFELIF